MKSYRERISETLARAGFIGQYDPRHVEAFMRGEHPTLDGLSTSEFGREVLSAAKCVDAGGKALAEDVAQSFGF